MENINSPENVVQTFESSLTEEDFAHLFNYPSIGELFSEGNSQRASDFCRRLEATAAELERIIRYGSRAEAESAERAVGAVRVTLDFIKSLEEMRQRQKN